MTQVQRTVAILAATVVALTLLFPPFTISGRTEKYNMGYAPIFAPPALGAHTASVDIPLLLVQWAGIAFITACVWVVFSRTGQGPKFHASVVDGQSERLQLSLSSQVWRRFWATNIDFFLALFVLNLFALALGWRWPGGIFQATSFALLVAVCILVTTQALFLSALGTTPGKALLGIRVLQASGGKLSFWNALRRSADVLVRGCGVYLLFPLLQLLLFWMNYKTIRREGVSPWDKASGGDHQVIVAPLTGFRFALGVAVCLATFFGVMFTTGLLKSTPKFVEMTPQELINCFAKQALTRDQCISMFLDSAK